MVSNEPERHSGAKDIKSRMGSEVDTDWVNVSTDQV